MDESNVMGMVALIVSLGGTILGIINHKRLRSKCCGRNAEVSIDVENTTPPQPHVAPPPVSAPKD